MSNIHKNSKININFFSTGKFLNLNKPKFLSLKKQPDKNNKNKIFKPINHNISQDITPPIETITKLTENNSKDEIIKALKERLTTLENKVKFLEKENNDNPPKINELNLSNDFSNNVGEQKSNQKLNLKLFKKDKKIKVLKFFKVSKSAQKENNKIINNNSVSKFININNDKNIFLNRNNNFLSIFNIKNNLNTIKNKNININNNYNTLISNSESTKKTKNYIIIPKKKLFLDLKKSLTKYSSIDNYKFKNNSLKNDKNIPKIPFKKRISNKSIQYKNSVDKYKYSDSTNSPEINNIVSYTDKKNEFIFNINNGNEKCNNELNFDVNNNSHSFNKIKNKLETIKIRTKNLLEYYSSNNINNINNDNIYLKKSKSNDIFNNKDYFINTEYI